MDIIESELGRKTANLAFEAYGLRGDFDRADITDRLDPDESRSLEDSLNRIILTGNEDDVIRQCVHKWKRDKLQEEEKNVIDMLTLADAEKNEDASRKLSERLMQIRTEIEAHGGKI